jgi:arylsulfatase A-like enzyme
VAFLTADHGAAHNYQFMQENRLHGGQWLSQELKAGLENFIAAKFGNKHKVVIGIYDYRFFLDHEAIRTQGLDLQQVKDVAIEYLRQSPNLSFVVDYEKAAYAPIPSLLRHRILLGYNFHRSGDIIVVPEPGYYDYGSWSSPVGTTHGEWNPYDAHIPLLFYGWKVPHGSSSAEVHITDIAPTVCDMLHIQQPNACIGTPLPFN